jgi:hypothetical protein
MYVQQRKKGVNVIEQPRRFLGLRRRDAVVVGCREGAEEQGKLHRVGWFLTRALLVRHGGGSDHLGSAIAT